MTDEELANLDDEAFEAQAALLDDTAEQAELKKMPGLAKRIMEYQPQPDPLEQARKQLELEKLKAEIAEKMSRASENQYDMKMKEAKAVLEEAKARQVHSAADKVDLDFTKEATGEKHREAMEMENLKARNKLLEKQMGGNN